MKSPRSPKGSLEVCGQRFKMIPVSKVVCFLPAINSCSEAVVGPENGTLGLTKAGFCQASTMKKDKA